MYSRLDKGTIVRERMAGKNLKVGRPKPTTYISMYHQIRNIPQLQVTFIAYGINL